MLTRVFFLVPLAERGEELYANQGFLFCQFGPIVIIMIGVASGIIREPVRRRRDP